MSLLFEQGSKPQNLVAKYWGLPLGDFLTIGTDKGMIDISTKDFVDAVRSFLFSNDLVYKVSDTIEAIQCEDWTLMVRNKAFCQFSPDDFIALVQYVWTNSNLVEHDLREELVNEIVFGDKKAKDLATQKRLFEWLANLQVVEGFPQYPPPKIKSRRFTWPSQN